MSIQNTVLGFELDQGSCPTRPFFQIGFPSIFSLSFSVIHFSLFVLLVACGCSKLID